MRRNGLIVLGVLMFLAWQAGPARAQWGYPGGYGGYGWGGWGSATAGGSIARGMGVYAAGLGAGREETAQANAINASTLGEINEYLYESQQVRNRRYWDHEAREQQENLTSRDDLYKRLRDNPTESDIASGDALNVALDQLTNPKLHNPVMQEARKVPLGSQTIKQVPYQYASEGVTIALSQLTVEEGWPLALRDDAFAPLRQAYEQAIQAALKQDEDGDLSEDNIQHVRRSVVALRDALEKSTAPEPARQEAEQFLKGLAGLARMLARPDIESVLARLENETGTTLADLLAFMESYNLRFGSAQTPQDRELYTDLYPLLNNLRNTILSSPLAQNSNVDPLTENPIQNRQARAGQFFGGMNWNHLNQGVTNPNDNPPPQ